MDMCRDKPADPFNDLLNFYCMRQHTNIAKHIDFQSRTLSWIKKMDDSSRGVLKKKTFAQHTLTPNTRTTVTGGGYVYE